MDDSQKNDMQLQRQLAYTDVSLLAGLAGGDQSALRVLYDEWYLQLLYFAQSLIHNQAQAEDIVIIAFTRYWERRTLFSDKAAIKSFLYITVRNDCYKFHNQQQTRARHLQAVAEQSPDAEFAESRMVVAEVIQHIHQEIDKLNPIYRDVIYLLFVEEKTIAETAAQLDITPETVRKRKERALSVLKYRIIKHQLGPLALVYLMAKAN
jgi:RNA polymerase sigma factor (sigma-70 family)